MWKTCGTARRSTDSNIIRWMRFAWWITKATSTHLEYVILPALSRQQRSRERASTLRYTSVATLAKCHTHKKNSGFLRWHKCVQCVRSYLLMCPSKTHKKMCRSGDTAPHISSPLQTKFRTVLVASFLRISHRHPPVRPPADTAARHAIILGTCRKVEGLT